MSKKIKSPYHEPKCKKHCGCRRVLKLSLKRQKELELQLRELKEARYGKKKKKDDKEDLVLQMPPKKKGAPTGHPGWFRQKPDAFDEIETIVPDRCHRCGSNELEASQVMDEEHIQEDIVLPKRVTKKFIKKVLKCKKCRSLVRGGPGRDEMPNSYIGPKAKAWANQLRYEIGIPQNKIKQIFTHLFDMPFVQASVAGFENQLRRRSEGLYDQIKEKIVHAPSRYADETGWKESGQGRQLWCFCNKETVLFHIDKSRGSKVLKSIFGSPFKGTMISDFYSAYNILYGRKQRCIPHLLRIIHRKELLFLGENKESDQFLEDMKVLSLRVMELFRRRKSITDYTLHRSDTVAMIKRRLKTPLAFKPLDKWRKKIKEHRRELTTCLFHPSSDSNNNFVERMLRSSVIMRKITFGNRSINGIQNHQVIMSVLQTVKLHNRLPADIFYGLLLKPHDIAIDDITRTNGFKVKRAPPKIR